MLVSHGYLSLRNEHCCAKLLPVKWRNTQIYHCLLVHIYFSLRDVHKVSHGRAGKND